jgi:hypothetical protein
VFKKRPDVAAITVCSPRNQIDELSVIRHQLSDTVVVKDAAKPIALPLEFWVLISVQHVIRFCQKRAVWGQGE